MGDAILKTYILLPVVLILSLSSFALAQTSVAIIAKQQQYDNYFNRINEDRIGVENSDIDKMVNPFIYVSSEIVVSSNSTMKSYILNAIFEDRVLINDQWLQLKSKIDNMTVTSIKDNSVILTSSNKKIEIYLRKKNENSFIKTN